MSSTSLPLSRYQWKIGSWGECAVVAEAGADTRPEDLCGGGLQRRNLTCYDVKRGRPAAHNLCFEAGDAEAEINLVKRYSSSHPPARNTPVVINLL